MNLAAAITMSGQMDRKSVEIFAEWLNLRKSLVFPAIPAFFQAA